MNFKEVAPKIVELVGGKENITAHTHCMTRLRFTLADNTKVKETELKNIAGVQGVVNKGGQYQIIIGPDVEQLYNEIAPLCPSAKAEAVVEENTDEKKESIFNVIFAFISGSITPALPVLIGSGLISAVLALAANFGWMDKAGSTYTLLNTLANAAYSYLPVLVAFAAAKRLKTNEYVAAFIMLALCSAVTSGETPVTIFCLPVTSVKYTSNIVPALFMVPVMALIDKWLIKVLPTSVKSILRTIILAMVLFRLFKSNLRSFLNFLKLFNISLIKLFKS
ncbi:MAG: PTS transporter subunit EIIB, partial [Erysipelotrichaceae bacterium]|nr:PTS transporter subunit EIIB [Erysipelotrichaceae bacterium]